MQNLSNLLDYEREVKIRMRDTLKRQNYKQATAARVLSVSPSTLNRILDPEGATKLTLEFLASFAANFCGSDITSLLAGETVRDLDTAAIFMGLPEDIQRSIYERAVSEAEDFRRLLKR